MLRKLAPLLTVLLSILLDTAILPVFYYGRFLVPVSLAVVILCGVQLGRTSGMLFGMIAGLLLDVSAGSLGLKLFPYVIIGFLVGFFLDQQPEISRNMDRSERLQRFAVRVIWVFFPLLLHEIVMLVYQYFSTAIFEWSYVADLLLRTLMLTALCLLLYAPLHRLFFGRTNPARKSRDTREVKRF